MPLESPADKAEREARSIALERAYVHDSYDRLAPHLGSTRYQPWPQVKNFLEELESGSVVCDVGCGNGKYLKAIPGIITIGCDRSRLLVGVAKGKKNEVLVSDALSLPFRDDSFDAAICIAVVHHLATRERRIQALKELARVVKVGGKLLVTVWAKEQKYRKFESQDVLIPWRPPERSSSEEIESSVERESLNTVTATDDEGFHSQAEAHSDVDKNPSHVTSAVRPATQDPITSEPIRSNEEYVTSRRRPRGRSRRIDPSSPQPLLSQSSSELSSPSETCYSFVRRALQKLTSSKRAQSDEIEEARCSSRSSDRPKTPIASQMPKLQPTVEENPFNCPIELRLLEPEEVDPPLGEERYRKRVFTIYSPVMALRSVSEKLATRSRSLSSLLSNAVKSDLLNNDDQSETEDTSFWIEHSQSSEPSLKTKLSTSTVTHMKTTQEKDLTMESSERRRPQLQKQKGFNDDENQLKTKLSSVKEITVEKSTPRLIKMKQTSLNENLIFKVDQQNKTPVKRQISLREDILGPAYRIADKTEPCTAYSTAQSSLKRLRDSFSRMTSSMSQSIRMSSSDLSESSLKSSLVKMIQQFRTEDRCRSASPSTTEVPLEVRTHPNVTRIQNMEMSLSPSWRSKDFLTRAISETNMEDEVHKSQSRTFLERKLTREEGSDSSKDSSLQSDTSVDSEDSCVSVIFIPKEALLASKQEAAENQNLSPKTRNSSSSSNSDNSIHDNKSPPKSPALTLAQRRALANSRAFSPNSVFSTPLSNSKFIFPEKNDKVPEVVIPSVIVSITDTSSTEESIAQCLLSETSCGSISSKESISSLISLPVADNDAIFEKSEQDRKDNYIQNSVKDDITNEASISNEALKITTQVPLWQRRTQTKISLTMERDPVVVVTKRQDGFKKRFVPRMLSYEIFNPETDDIDSDSDASSTPDSASTIFDSEKIWKLRKVFSEAAMNKDVESSDSECDDTATRFAKNRRSTILALGINVPIEKEEEDYSVSDVAGTEIKVAEQTEFSTTPEATKSVLDPLEAALKEMEKRVEPERIVALEGSFPYKGALSCVAEEIAIKSCLGSENPIVMRKQTPRKVACSLVLPSSHGHARHSIAATELVEKDKLDLLKDRKVQSLDNTRPRLTLQRQIGEFWEKDRERQILLEFMKEIKDEMDEEVEKLNSSSYPSTSSFGETSTGSSFSSSEYLKPRPTFNGNKQLRNKNPKLTPEFRDSSLSLSTSQDSLPSDSGGAPTLHRYYHVFSEGELDRLIERHVPNLDIVSSYYDHANWCVVAEKVQLWTI